MRRDLTFKKMGEVFLLALSISSFALIACSEKNTERRVPAPAATGRGNGGNTKVSTALVRQSIENLKTPLLKSFEGLRALGLAEKTLAGSTTINGDEELLNVILLMTKDSEMDLEDGYVDEAIEDERPSVFDDIKTKDNLNLSEKGCFDYRDIENAAGTELLGIGTGICFSLPKLQSQTLEGGETAFQISLLGLATHEFVHHFVKGKNHEETEAIANKLQDFLVRDLSRASVLSTDSIISIDEFDFVDQFVKESKELLEQVKNIAPAREEDPSEKKPTAESDITEGEAL